MASLQLYNQAGDQNPVGIIIIWSGFIANIPERWNLCDGTNGTPDLRDRFSRGVPTAVTNPGSVGGVTAVTITTGNMSSHLHSGSGTNHNHLVRVSDVTTGGQGKMVLGGDGPDKSKPATSLNKVVNPVQFQGGNGSHNNMPLYYEVVYLQRSA
jgi:microcystin-dependent protein